MNVSPNYTWLCPHCNADLKFDLKIRKYRCPKCGAIFTVDIKTRENGKMFLEYREWKEIIGVFDTEKIFPNMIKPMMITYEL